MITETLQVQHVPSLRETPRPSIGGHRPTVDLRCTCRWVSQLSYDTAAEALAAHSDHVHAFNTIRVPGLTPGDRLRFGDRSAVWLVRATAASGRYAIATTPHFGTVRNTVIDRLEQVRGPMNVIGYGPDITTRSGPDTGVDDMVRRLEGRPEPDEVAAAAVRCP